MGRTIASTCLLKLCSFHSRAPQNDNVESQKFASSASGNRDGKLIYFHLELKAAQIRYSEVDLWHCKRRLTHATIFELKFIF